MDWTAIGAVGELLGAIAVVVSIGYLAAQVRQNTESVRLGSFQSAIDRVAAVNARTGDAHVADVLARGRGSYFKLSPADRITFGYYMQERLLMYESSLAMAHLLKPTVLDVVQKNICFHLSFPGVREWWMEPGRELLAQDFEDEVGRLAGIDGPRAVEDADRLGAT